MLRVAALYLLRYIALANEMLRLCSVSFVQGPRAGARRLQMRRRAGTGMWCISCTQSWLRRLGWACCTTLCPPGRLLSATWRWVDWASFWPLLLHKTCGTTGRGRHGDSCTKLPCTSFPALSHFMPWPVLVHACAAQRVVNDGSTEETLCLCGLRSCQSCRGQDTAARCEGSPA